MAIVVRGLVANLGLVLPVVLLLAAFMIWSNPDRKALLRPELFGYPLNFVPVEHFGITLLLALLGLALFFLWALYRSVFVPADKQSEFRTRLPALAGTFLVVLAGSFFCELQPFVVAGMFDIRPIFGLQDRQSRPDVGLDRHP